MVRLLGAILVAGGAAWTGLSAAEGLKRRVRALDALVDGLSLLEQELELDSSAAGRKKQNRINLSNT